MGKMGTYTEKPNLKVNWNEYSDHGVNDSMTNRGITQEMVDSYVANGKALSQGNGKLVTTWSSGNYDASMLDIVKKLFGK